MRISNWSSDVCSSDLPAPVADASGPFAMLATTLEADNFVGRILTGRIHSGTARLNMPVKVMRRGGKVMTGGRLTKMLSFQGLTCVPIEEAAAGDIVAIAGLADATVADTICAPEFAAPLDGVGRAHV